MHIRPLEFEDLFNIDLRQADKDELEALYCADPQTGLLMSYTQSQLVYTIDSLEDGPVAIFGTAAHPQDDSVGVGWMLGSDLITKNWMSFTRLTPAIIEIAQRPYSILCNYIDTRNTTHIRWLEYAGFTFGHVNYSVSPKGVPFQFFWRFNPSCVDQP